MPLPAPGGLPAAAACCFGGPCFAALRGIATTCAPLCFARSARCGGMPFCPGFCLRPPTPLNSGFAAVFIFASTSAGIWPFMVTLPFAPPAAPAAPAMGDPATAGLPFGSFLQLMPSAIAGNATHNVSFFMDGLLSRLARRRHDNRQVARNNYIHHATRDFDRRHTAMKKTFGLVFVVLAACG